tara:strand:+ start:322 stop:603 length:282 start_codon:yes stop_codon:yes gene_type:complete
MDKRRNNGGNSTKAKGVDKRKNDYKSVLESTLTHEDLGKVVKMLFNKAVKDEDTTSAKILMEYYLGKPKETIEQTHNVSTFDIKDIFKFDTKG